MCFMRPIIDHLLVTEYLAAFLSLNNDMCYLTSVSSSMCQMCNSGSPDSVYCASVQAVHFTEHNWNGT